MANYVSVIFCKSCGSRYVEISDWTKEGKSVIRCRTCGAQEESGKFTLGRCSVSDRELDQARISRANKSKLGDDRYER